MKNQHQVVLSLGSNQGNRLENIEKCLLLIHQEVGTIIQVSKVYETPSWGFESDAFYNCAIRIHTHKKAHEILIQVLAIEKQLGRIRLGTHGYQSRSIDIDLISFDLEIISTENLQIPHPLMQERKFVLLPMQDLNLNWKHPILNKNTTELLATCPDKSSCKVIHNLENPLDQIQLKQFQFIAFEGNIGAGKTSLTTKIAEDFKAKILTERFADNPFLPQFYEDQKRYALPLELSFLVDRHKQLTSDLDKLATHKEWIVADYSVFKSLIFAKITLDEREYKLYHSLFESIYKKFSKPDLYVYLYQNQDRLLANIKKRGRDYEQNISEAYLEKINTGYLEFMQSNTLKNKILIDITDLDFVKNQLDYVTVLEKIKEGITNLSTV